MSIRDVVARRCVLAFVALVAGSACDLIAQSGETLTFALDCETRVIFDTAVVSVRMVNSNRLVRFNPEFPELDMHYERCKP